MMVSAKEKIKNPGRKPSDYKQSVIQRKKWSPTNPIELLAKQGHIADAIDMLSGFA